MWDDQGKSGKDTATVTVKKNPEERNVIRAVFNQDVDLLTKARLDGIVSSMSLLLHNSGKYRIEVLGLAPQADSNNAVMDFYVVQSDSEVETVTTVRLC